MKNTNVHTNTVLVDPSPEQLEICFQQLSDNLQIETLDLGFFTKAIKTKWLEGLTESVTKNTYLKRLVLMSTGVSSSGSIIIAKLVELNDTLEELILWDNNLKDIGVATIIKALSNNNKLHVLDLGANKITNLGLQFLENALGANTALTSLKLNSNELRNEGVILINKALHANNSLLYLDLETNYIESQGIIELAKGLSTTSVLNHLNLSNNAIGDTGFKALADMLKENANLKTLQLAGNKLTIFGIKCLVNSLMNNQTLKHLNLNSNNLRDEGGVEIAKMLEINEGLVVLKLGNSRIGNPGLKAICGALQQNCTLTELGLSSNQIATIETITIAEMLMYNSTLDSLNLALNKISIDDIKLLAESLWNNPHSNLSSLDLSYCLQPVISAYTLNKILESNFIIRNLSGSDSLKENFEFIKRNNRIYEKIITQLSSSTQTAVVNNIINDTQKFYCSTANLLASSDIDLISFLAQLEAFYKNDGLNMRLYKLKAFEIILNIEQPSWKNKYNNTLSKVLLKLIGCETISLSDSDKTNISSFLSMEDIKVDSFRDIDYLMQGKVYLEDNQYNKAIYYFNRAIETNSNYFSAFNYKSIVLKKLGQVEKLERCMVVIKSLKQQRLSNQGQEVKISREPTEIDANRLLNQPKLIQDVKYKYEKKQLDKIINLSNEFDSLANSLLSDNSNNKELDLSEPLIGLTPDYL